MNIWLQFVKKLMIISKTFSFHLNQQYSRQLKIFFGQLSTTYKLVMVIAIRTSYPYWQLPFQISSSKKQNLNHKMMPLDSWAWDLHPPPSIIGSERSPRSTNVALSVCLSIIAIMIWTPKNPLRTPFQSQSTSYAFWLLQGAQ